MPRIEFETHGNPQLIKAEDVGGALEIHGWNRDEIRIDAPQPGESFIYDEDTLTFKTRNRVTLRVPRNSKLEIGSVGGSASIQDIDLDASLRQIGGSLNLKNLLSLEADSISGSLNANNLQGNLNIKSVKGNANIKGVEGEINLPEVKGNLNLRAAYGNASINASGNAQLLLDPVQDSKQSYVVAGNVFCRLEGPADAVVTLKSKADEINLRDSFSSDIDPQGNPLTFGEGGAELSIEAGGSIMLHHSEVTHFDPDFDFGGIEDFDGIAEEISEQINSQLDQQLEALNAQLDALNERMQQKGQRAVAGAQRRVEAAQRRLERKLVARRSGRRSRPKPGHPTGSGSSASAEPVSEAERLLVLKMLEDKKIGVEEAQMLLRSLEGKDSATSKEE